MLNEYTVNPRQDSWINGLSRIIPMRLKPSRVYDYSRAIHGVDYVFDRVSEKDSGGYMTAQRGGVKVGDQILLTQDGVVNQYRIQELDYYSSPGDMWIALLTRVNQ